MVTRGSMSEGQLARVVLETLHRVMRQIWAEVKGEAGELFPAQSYRMLGMLAQRPYTLTELARAQAVRPSTVSRAIRTLSEQGWVRVERDPSDRRRVWIRLTPQGRRALRRLQARAAARLGRRLRPLGPEERALLAQAMALLQRTLGPAEPSPQQGPREAQRARRPIP
ncbi:MarR family winged helix-turn-helix transcriptional regulator [Thermoflexus hugenholtzii]|uniref:DNA-binding transcriptional regulator, MarR family n=1 Tax=Thermoflexus hugenholtzii JAD2 TaxID=877466 RepID=A0A212QN68_9CHLR|nr:MarR family transcriptional regulator [Thermoflexus hugenholtzii]SNB60820.1 DNA-binding transcriptional regulator, MarR family [Thermoflexus hugenholtzii JAD2]